MGKHGHSAPPPGKDIPKDGQGQAGDFWHELEHIEEEIIHFNPAFIIPVLFALVLLVLFFLRRYLRWTVPCTSKNKITGKTVLITGANTGIGRATAFELAKRGGHIILACRDHAKGDAVARLIKKKTKNSNVKALKLDVGNIRSIKEFVDDNFSSNDSSLHILINNAAYLGPKAATDDGYERSFGVNHLGHFYLTYLLKEKLKKCAPSRVINVVSDSYKKAHIDFNDLAMHHNYDSYTAYGRSKLGQLLFTVESHRHWSSSCVRSYAVHPGYVYTDLLRYWPGLEGNLLRIFSRVMFMSPEDGCQTIIHCAVADKLNHHSGKLFENCAPTKYKDFVKDKALGRQLWERSLHLCGLEHEIPLHDDEEEGGEDKKQEETKKDQ